MTTTNYTVGLGSDPKTSSRILKPPGGASSDIFGTNAGSGQEGGGRRNNYNKSNMFEEASATPAEQASENRRQADEGHQESASSENSTDSANPTGSSKQGGGNPITGEGYNAESKEDSSFLPAVKVRNPPGGHSTKLW